MLARIEQDARKWYVLIVAPNHERIAASHLAGRRFTIYLPTMLIVVGTRGVRRAKQRAIRPVFPGYLFVRLEFQVDHDRLHFVRSAPGVHKFLQLDESYAVISQADMERIGRIEEALMKPRAKSSIWNVGETVRINEGPFSGFTGSVERLDDNERIRVLVSMFGRDTPLELATSELEKL